MELQDARADICLEARSFRLGQPKRYGPRTGVLGEATLFEGGVSSQRPAPAGACLALHIHLSDEIRLAAEVLTRYGCASSGAECSVSVSR